MANICSTYLQIFPKDPQQFTAAYKMSDLIAELLSGTNGYSYNTPLFCSMGKYGKYIEIAFGEKWSPSSILDYFENHRDEIDIAFYRYYDDGNDYDFMNCLFDGNTFKKTIDSASKERRLCRYGFDRITFSTDTPVKHDAIQHLGKDHYHVDMTGNYLAYSDYSNLLNKSSGFSDFKIDEDSYASIIDKQILFTKQHNNPIWQQQELLSKVENIASDIQYYYKGKLVTYAITKNEYLKRGYVFTNAYLNKDHSYKWLYFSFDSWFNCVDPYYLLYLEDLHLT